MKRPGNWTALVCALAVALCACLSAAFAAGDKEQAPTNGNMYWPSDKLTTPGQLKGHIEKMEKVPLTARQAGYGEAMVTTADRMLSANPPPQESLRAFAAAALLDGLHEWAATEKNADADKRLTVEVQKYTTDSDKKVAGTAELYAMEQKVLKPDDIPPADVPKLLDDLKKMLGERTINIKFERIATGTTALINKLSTDEEAEKRFKEFSQLYVKSIVPSIIRVGNQMRTAKRDTKAATPGDKPADAVAAAPANATPAAPVAMAAPAATMPVAPAPAPAVAAAPTAPAGSETPQQWLDRVESQLSALAGSAHDADYEREKTTFMQQFSQDPLRWRWNLLDARRAMSVPENRAQGLPVARAALAAVLTAGDAPEELRDQASMMNIKLDFFSRRPVTDLAKEISAHGKAFPNSANTGVLAKSLVEMIAQGQGDQTGTAAPQK